MVAPRHVTTGSPAQSASLAVVWALYGNGIDAQIGEPMPREMIRQIGLAGKYQRAAGTAPRFSASRRRFAVAVALVSISHSTLPSTAPSKRIQMSNISGNIL